MSVLFVVLLSFCSQGWSQITRQDLQKLYGKSANDSFVVGGGVNIHAYFGKNNLVCGLTILGANSQQQVKRIFDVVVPEKIRGAKKDEMIECAGPCESMAHFSNVHLDSGVFDAFQRSNPSAVIIFERPDCDQAGAELQKITLATYSVNSR